MASLQQQLIATPPECFFNFFNVGIDIRYIGVRMTGNPVEITKLTIGNANIGGIYIAVDLPGHFSVSHLLFTKLISYKHQFGQRCFIKKRNALLPLSENQTQEPLNRVSTNPSRIYKNTS